MRIAVITDIHGNLPALEASLATIVAVRAGLPVEFAEKLIVAA